MYLWSMEFSLIRNQALSRLIHGKKWEVIISNGNVSINRDESVECVIQNHPLNKGRHINVMCSMNDYCLHIFDLLTDNRYDSILLDNNDERKVELKDSDATLFRVYNRLFMFGYETLEILVKLYMFGIRNSNKARARQDLSWPYVAGATDTIDIISRYVNKIVKHNLDGFHRCNNHIPVYFQDGEGAISTTKRLIKAKYLTDAELVMGNVDGIVVPNLMGLVESLLYAYGKIETLFAQEDNLRRLIARYSEVEEAEGSDL